MGNSCCNEKDTGVKTVAINHGTLHKHSTVFETIPRNPRGSIKHYTIEETFNIADDIMNGKTPPPSQKTNGLIFEWDCLYFRKVYVYDGDTLSGDTTIEIPVISNNGIVEHCNENDANGIILLKIHVRIFGYDSPELHTKNKDDARRGKLAKEYLLQELLCTSNIKCVVCPGILDKYGRLLGIVFKENADGTWTNMSRRMIEFGHGRPYAGGTKGVDAE